MLITRELDDKIIAQWDGEDLTIKDRGISMTVRLSPRAQIELVRLFEEIVTKDLRDQL
jgi:hypothetical protein